MVDLVLHARRLEPGDHRVPVGAVRFVDRVEQVRHVPEFAEERVIALVLRVEHAQRFVTSRA